MKHLWVDSGHDPIYEKAAAHGVRGLFFDMHDERVTKPYLQAVAARGYQVGVYMASSWPQYQGQSGARIAEIVHETVAPLRLSDSFPKVQFDMEEHDPVLIADTLRRWRELRKTQDTSWTMEPMQGGWFTPAFVQTLLACRVRVVPQAYFGGMEPVAQDIVLRDILLRGIPMAVVSLFYDAKDLPALWDGFAFTQGRLS